LGTEKFVEPQKLEEHKIVYKGEEFVIKTRPVTWSMRNKAMSEAIKIDKKGASKIDLDAYSKYILCARIVEAPWGITSYTFLNEISPELGEQLNTLIPSFFGVEEIEEDELKNE